MPQERYVAIYVGFDLRLMGAGDVQGTFVLPPRLETVNPLAVLRVMVTVAPELLAIFVQSMTDGARAPVPNGLEVPQPSRADGRDDHP